jgi:hypothetical protein
VIACLALFFAIAGGSAIALKGRNSVDSGDIRKGQVKTSDLANNAVTSKKIKNGQVRPGDLAPDEAYHKVGAPGQPGFGNGGENDCLWGNARSLVPDFGNPAAFYKDRNGIVHLAGLVVAQDGPSGDTTCDFDATKQDSLVFTLPPGYRPANLELQDVSFWSGEGDDPTDTANSLIIGPTRSLNISGTAIGAGQVLIQTIDAENFSLDGITFRAAGAGTGLPRRGGQPSGSDGGLDTHLFG